MNLSIIGYGQMGQLIEKCALDRKHTIRSIIDPHHSGASHKEFCDEAMKNVDVCISFTQPNAAIANIEDACKWKKSLVIGTTGWTEQMEHIKAQVTQAEIGLIYSSNFSLGVNIFFKMVEHAGKIMNQFDLYDLFAHEEHHAQKKDSPSGTAVTIGNILLDTLSRKTKIVTQRLDRSIQPDELHIASMRGGKIPGTHSVLFDSDFDTIELKHTARNRLGFATGAVLAAEWIIQKKGLFTEADLMKQLLPNI